MKKIILLTLLVCPFVSNLFAQTYPFFDATSMSSSAQTTAQKPACDFTSATKGDFLLVAVSYNYSGSDPFNSIGSNFSNSWILVSSTSGGGTGTIVFGKFYTNATSSTETFNETQLGKTLPSLTHVLTQFRLRGVLAQTSVVGRTAVGNNKTDVGVYSPGITSNSSKAYAMVLSMHVHNNQNLSGFVNSSALSVDIPSSSITIRNNQAKTTSTPSVLIGSYIVSSTNKVTQEFKSSVSSTNNTSPWVALQFMIEGQDPFITNFSTNPIKACEAFTISGYNFSAGSGTQVEFVSSSNVTTAAVAENTIYNSTDGSYTTTGTVPPLVAGNYTLNVLANGATTSYSTPIQVTTGCATGDFQSTAASNLWSNQLTWQQYNANSGWITNGIPSSGNNVKINSNVIVDIVDAQANSLDIQSGNSLTFNSGKSVIVSGNVTNSGLLNVSNGTLSIGGDFSNQGTFTSGSSSNVILTGASTQTISGTPMIFRNLTLNGAGNKVPSMDLTVLGAMTFTSGYLVPATGYQLILGKDATVSGANKDSYVKGSVTKIGSVTGTSFTFPTGQSNGVYDPVIIGYNKTTNDVEFKVTQTNGAAGLISGSGQTKIGVLASVDLGSVTEYWDIHPTWNSYATGSNPGVDVTLHYHNLNAVETGAANLYVIHQSALGWELPSNASLTGTSSIDGFTVRKIMISNVTNFSNYSYLGTDNVLPVLLGSFNAKLTPDNHVNVSWITNSEISNKGFHIQRQSNLSVGKYENIGFVTSKALGGNSAGSLSYNFVDVAPVNGQNSYYRLGQEDLNGNMVYSEVRMIKMNGKSISMVFPNPSTGAVNISRTADGHKMNIQVIDQSGRMVNQYNNISDANYRLTIAQPGVYSIKMIYPETGEQSIQRVVVQK